MEEKESIPKGRTQVVRPIGLQDKDREINMRDKRDMERVGRMRIMRGYRNSEGDRRVFLAVGMGLLRREYCGDLMVMKRVMDWWTS